MKYTGKIEAKEEKKTKANTQYFCFTIDGKKWNCFDAIANKEFVVGDYVEFETELKTCCKNPQRDAKHNEDDKTCSTCGNEYKKFENLLPETMKKVNAQENKSGNALIPQLSGTQFPETSVHKNINENPDSFEIGTPGKLGVLKCYGDFNKPDEFLEKIKNAKKVRDEANKLLTTE